MKAQLTQSQILLEARALKEEQEVIFLQYETNQRRRRRRSEVTQPPQGPRANDGNVLLPGHIHPSLVNSADIPSDLPSNVSLRGNQTFFENINGAPPNKQTELLSQQDAIEKNNPNFLSKDISRAHLIGQEIHGHHPPKSMIASNDPEESDLSSHSAPNNAAKPAGETGCRAKKRREQQQAHANFRAYESNQTVVNATEPGQVGHLGNSFSTAANSTRVAPSVPHLNLEERQEGLSKASLAGISLAIIILASIPIAIVIIRRRRRQRKRKLSAMFDKGTTVFVGPPIASAPDLHYDHQDISPKEMDELMNRVASVQAPPAVRQSKNI